MRRHARVFLSLAGLIACVTASGCGHPNAWDFAKDYVGTKRKALAYLAYGAYLKYDGPRDLVSADRQREAILEMSHRWWGMDAAPVRGYSVVAEGSGGDAPTARSAALRALARAGDEAVVHVDRIITALNARSVYVRRDALLAHVRWDAALALDSVVDDKAVDGYGYVDDDGNTVDNGLIAHVRRDPGNRKSERSPDVRAACARALRHYRRTDVVAVLAEAVEDEKEDLLVRWHAHDSLVEIVGVDRGWARSDWEGDTKKLPPLPQPEKRWWEHILGLFARDGDNDETDGGEP